MDRIDCDAIIRSNGLRTTEAHLMIGIQLVVGETVLWTASVGYCLHNQGTACRVVACFWPAHLCMLGLFCGYVLQHLRQYLVMRGDYIQHLDIKSTIPDAPKETSPLKPTPTPPPTNFGISWEVV